MCVSIEKPMSECQMNLLFKFYFTESDQKSRRFELYRFGTHPPQAPGTGHNKANIQYDWNVHVFGGHIRIGRQTFEASANHHTRIGLSAESRTSERRKWRHQFRMFCSRRLSRTKISHKVCVSSGVSLYIYTIQ